MRLYFHKDPLGNFGDDLNPWLFEKLLPEAFDSHCYHDPALRQSTDDTEPLFVGIGTLLNDKIPKEPLKAIFGSGAGYGPASTIDERWNVYCVRGPRTAASLGLPPEKAVTDAAALCRRIDLPKVEKTNSYAFMPHCSTARLAYWDRVCADLGVAYLDPQGAVDEIFAALQSTEVLVTEAMHGAILADTLRIPWVPVTTTAGVLKMKWEDWCSSLDLTYNPWRLPALWRLKGPAGLVKQATGFAKFQLAKRALKSVLDKARPALSDERLLESRVDQLESLLELFKADVAQGQYAGCKAGI
ncbi:MAG: polysaccharide pyruvyl transferase family protein [Geminicoccaceae bacterium]